ncbi:MAG: hypothetical protein PUP92_33280, partial [Rhizonema sp. PD38]|nr:hypothetical protein [Rhizonema sp. PD38]
CRCNVLIATNQIWRNLIIAIIFQVIFLKYNATLGQQSRSSSQRFAINLRKLRTVQINNNMHHGK